MPRFETDLGKFTSPTLHVTPRHGLPYFMLVAVDVDGRHIAMRVPKAHAIRLADQIIAASGDGLSDGTGPTAGDILRWKEQRGR